MNTKFNISELKSILWNDRHSIPLSIEATKDTCSEPTVHKSKHIQRAKRNIEKTGRTKNKKSFKRTKLNLEKKSESHFNNKDINFEEKGKEDSFKCRLQEQLQSASFRYELCYITHCF